MLIMCSCVCIVLFGNCIKMVRMDFKNAIGSYMKERTLNLCLLYMYLSPFTYYYAMFCFN